jgi:selenocysteine-specific elongation factor
VRGIQRHNQPVASIGVSERAALNLSGIEPEEIERGNVLATPGYYQPTTIINASLYLLTEVSQPLKNMARVHLHIGTAETMCRVCLLDTKELTPGTEGLVQLRTEEPVICDFNDRFVLRHYSPLITIGGGTVLEAQAKKEPRFEPALLARLAGLKSGEPGAVLEQMLIKSGFDVKTVAGIARELAVSERDVEVLLGHLLKQNKVRLIETEGKYYCIHNQILAAALNAVRDQLTDYHRQNPLRLGIKQSELRAKVKLPGVLFELVLSELSKGGEVVIEGERVRRAGHELKLTPEEKRIFEQVAQVFLSAKWAPPEPDKVFAGIDKKLTARITIALLESGILIDLGDGILMHTQAVQAAEQILGALFQHKPELSASEFRQALGTTRKFVIPLLNYFDSIGLTQRKGDVRILRQAKNMPEKV